jgi:hypothetical protein
MPVDSFPRAMFLGSFSYKKRVDRQGPDMAHNRDR